MAVGETSQQPHVQTQPRFPFDIEFQKSLLRLITEDDSFGVAAAKHLRPEHFEHEILSWVYSRIARYKEQYNTVPTLGVVMQATHELDPAVRPLYTAMVDAVRQSSLRDAGWLRDQVLDFVRRNIFVRAFHEGRDLYNTGKVVQAYDLTMQRMEEIARTTWEPIDRTWFYSDLDHRQARRHRRQEEGSCVPTGFDWLDNIMRGGLEIGHVGMWMAYAKVGKTTMLVQHGVHATRRLFPTLHVVLEGSRSMIEDRYETSLTQESYGLVKSGQMNARTYQLATQEYQYLRGMLVIRSWTDEFDVNILHIDNELRELDRDQGWRPKLIVVDYADLMTGRNPNQYRSENQSQRAAIRDLKRLSGRGYAIWTATQAQRPDDKKMEQEHLLHSWDVADAYEKPRAVDFFGSINQTNAEADAGVMRAYAEMFRENKAGQYITLGCDWDKMLVWQGDSQPVRERQQQNKTTEAPPPATMGYQGMGTPFA